eukprot:gene33497-40528_t
MNNSMDNAALCGQGGASPLIPTSRNNSQGTLTDPFDATAAKGNPGWCTSENAIRAAQIIAIGSVVGGAFALAAPYAVAGYFYYGYGLSYAGPVAGGWFAANMGSGLVAGSSMSVLQSCAMTAGTYTTAAGIGGGVGGVGGTIGGLWTVTKKSDGQSGAPTVNKTGPSTASKSTSTSSEDEGGLDKGTQTEEEENTQEPLPPPHEQEQEQQQ